MQKVVVVKVRKSPASKKAAVEAQINKHVAAMKNIANKYVSMKKLLQEELNTEVESIMQLLDEGESDNLSLEDLLNLFK